MKKTLFALVGAILLLTACNTNTPSAISVKGKIYKHPTAVQYLKFKTDSVQYYGDFGNENLNNHTFAYTQKGEVVMVYTPTIEHLLAYEGFVLRNGQQYELFANTSDPNYQDNQPTDPATWSPIGKRYISTEGGLYENWQIYFLSADSLDKGVYGSGKTNGLRLYHIEYPYIYLENYGYATFMFIDTATIGKVNALADFPNTYQLVDY